MSVVEKLRAFRYTIAGAHGATAAGRELPWKAVRSVNVAAMKTEEPDLHLMKNLLSLLSDFTITASGTVHGASDADLLQLLQLMQASLQFALHSQNVLKGQLVERQNLEAVRQVSSKYIERMDAKLAVLSADNKSLKEECDTLKLSADTLRGALAQQEATARTLERQLEQERDRFYAAVTRQEKLLQLAQPTAAPPFPATSVDGKGGVCPACGRSLPTCGDAGAAGKPKKSQSSKKRKAKADDPAIARQSRHRYDLLDEDSLDAASETLTETSLEHGDGGGGGASMGTATEEERIALGLPALRRGNRAGKSRPVRERQRSPREKGRYVDWRTFAEFVERMQRQGPLTSENVSFPVYRRSRGHNDDDILFDSEHSAPVDALNERRGGKGLFGTLSSLDMARNDMARPWSPPREPATLSGAAEIRAALVSAIDGLKDGVGEQLSSMRQVVADNNQRLTDELAHLHRTQAQLAAQIATHSASVRQQVPPAAPVPPSAVAKVAAGEPQPTRKPATQTVPYSSHRPSSIQVTSTPDLPRHRQVQESVTPLPQSLPQTPVEQSFSLVKPVKVSSVVTQEPPHPTPLLQKEEVKKTGEAATTRASPATARGKGTAQGSTTPQAAFVASAPQPASPLSFHTQTAQTLTDSSGRGGPVVASTTNATLTSGVSTDRKEAKPPPSLQTSSLSARSRSSLPDFDISMLRTPPKGGEKAESQSSKGKKTDLKSSSAAGSPLSEAAHAADKLSAQKGGTGWRKGGISSTSEKRPFSSSVESGTGAHSLSSKRWYDTPNEERPASVADRTLAAAAKDASANSTTAGSPPLAPQNVSSTTGKVLDSKDDGDGEPLTACEHCRQKIPKTDLAAHEASCDLRLLLCASCGRRVVARLMPRHQCAAAATDADKTLSQHDSQHGTKARTDTSASALGGPGADSLENSRASSPGASLGPKRVSSLLLQETQRELQQLLEEEEAFQRSRNNASGVSDREMSAGSA